MPVEKLFLHLRSRLIVLLQFLLIYRLQEVGDGARVQRTDNGAGVAKKASPFRIEIRCQIKWVECNCL